MDKKTKIFLFHVNAHQSADFNYQMAEMTFSVNTRQPLSQITPVITQCAYEQSGPAGIDGSYAWAQQHGLPCTKYALAMAIAQCPVYQLQIETLSPQYSIIHQGY